MTDTINPLHALAWWSSSDGRLNLQMTLEDAASGSHSGDCEADVRAIMEQPYIATQVAEWSHEDMKRDLAEYGAWDDEELADEEMCKVRLVWFACGNIYEEALSGGE